MTTLTNLLTKLRLRTDLNSDDLAFSDTVLTEHLNAALRQIAVTHDWSWLVSQESIATVAGTATYTPDSANSLWRKSLSLSYLGTDLAYDERRSLDVLSQDTGLPKAWTVDQGVIYLYPIPDAAYSLVHRYVKVENTLSSGSDTPLLPAWADDLLIAKAAANVALRRGEGSDYRAFTQEYKQIMDDIVDDGRPATPFPRVRRRSDSLGGWV